MSQADIFLKIDGIQGESKDDAHPGELQLQSWSFGEHNSGSSITGGGMGTGKVSMQDFQFSISSGIHSPKLFQACAAGTHIPKAILTLRKAGDTPQEFMKVTFEDLLISSYHASGAGDIPNDQCSFNFKKITFDHKEQKEDGTLGGVISAGYDVAKNTKI